MSDIIQTIVFHLNEPPFEFNFRLIELDSKSPIQLFSLFIDILKTLGLQIDSELDESKAEHEILFQNPTLLESKLSTSIDSIQYPERSNPKFYHGLSFGDKRILYPLMAYCLNHQERIKEEIYLAKYLNPIELPLHITMTSKTICSQHEEPSLMQLMLDYKVLQTEFQDIFMKRVELKDEEFRFNAKNQQFKVLQEEEEKLKHRIQKNIEHLNGSQDLAFNLKMIEAIRKENEDAERLKQQFIQQEKISVQIQDEWNSYELTSKDLFSDTLDIRHILDDLHKKVTATSKKVRSDLHSRKNDVENELTEIQRLLDRPECSDINLEDITSKKNMLSSALKSKMIELQDSLHSKKLSKIHMLKKHLETATLATNEKTSETKNMKNELIELQTAAEKLDKEYDRRMKILNKDCIELPDGCILKSIDDRLSYVDQANKMMENAEGSKEKVSYLQKEISLLDDTIAAIIQRKTKKHYMLSKKEENVGATGYYHIQSNLQATNKQAEKTNELKENAMKEISRSVIEMKNILSSQQAKLQPMMDNLKELRIEYQKMKSKYDREKEQYNKLMRNISSERKPLEDEIFNIKTKWVDLERSHSNLEFQCNIAGLDIQKVCMEDENTRENRIDSPASGPLGLQKLYQIEIEQQECLCSKLLSEKKELIENEAKLKLQCECFDDLYTLMSIKRGEKINSFHEHSFGSVMEIAVNN